MVYNILHNIVYWTQHCKYWKLQKTKQKFWLYNKTFISYELKTHIHCLLHHWNILIESLAMFITRITHKDFINPLRISAKNPNEIEAHGVLETCYIPYYDNDSEDHSQFAHSLLNDGCPGSYGKLFWMTQRQASLFH